MKKLFTLFMITGLMAASLSAQNSAGKCWYIDYELWNINTPALHILCGNDESFNVGEELTMEMWIRAYTFGENRKVIGKIDSDGSTFNNGYVMGFQNLNVYTELWNPTLQQIPYGSAGPIPQDSAFVHLVTTYSAVTGKMIDYVNGEISGETQVFPPNPIEPNDAEFLIGSAPWDAVSFQFYGALDEVRVWNVARTEEQIREYMYKELKGDEEGLVAYYNFNGAYDSIVPDSGPFGNDGVLQNPDDDGWWWADSYIPVGDAKMYDLLEPAAAWCGKAGEEFFQAITENGFSVITDIQALEFDKYMVFARTDSSGTSTDFIPGGAPDDFMRLSREWYLNKGGEVTGDLFVNLEQASGGGDQLPAGADANLYVLLHRPDLESDFTALKYADQVFNENLIFNDYLLMDGYYSVGYSSTPMSIGIEEEVFENLSIGPNPASERIFIKNAREATLTIKDIAGREVFKTDVSSNYQTLNIQNLRPGIYFAIFEQDRYSVTHKMIIQR